MSTHSKIGVKVKWMTSEHLHDVAEIEHESYGAHARNELRIMQLIRNQTARVPPATRRCPASAGNRLSSIRHARHGRYRAVAPWIVLRTDWSRLRNGAMQTKTHLADSGTSPSRCLSAANGPMQT